MRLAKNNWDWLKIIETKENIIETKKYLRLKIIETKENIIETKKYLRLKIIETKNKVD